MTQTESLLKALKRELKARGVTYAQLAPTLDVSEATVKRLFAEQSFSLQRLEQVCRAIGLTFDELFAAARRDKPQLQQLSEDQEREIVDDLPLLLVAVSVLNGYSREDLLDYYAIDAHACTRYLVKLDRLKFIDLLPGDRIKLRVAPNFRWRMNGPIQRFFLANVQQAFFDARFDGDREYLRVLNGVLSDASCFQLKKLLETLAENFNDLMREDSAQPLDQRSGSTLVMALRPWQYPLFDALVKK